MAMYFNHISIRRRTERGMLCAIPRYVRSLLNTYFIYNTVIPTVLFTFFLNNS